ncbi:MAG: hypothetical protein H7837_10645 [Magnetococcus sp. MYC-9]
MITLLLIVVGSALAASLAQLVTQSAMATRNSLAGMQTFYFTESVQEILKGTLRNATPPCAFTTTSLTPFQIDGVTQAEYRTTASSDASVPPYWALTSTLYTPTSASPQGQRTLEWHHIRCTANYAPIYASGTNFSSVTSSYIRINGTNRWSDTPYDNCSKNVPAGQTACNAVDEYAKTIFVNGTKNTEKYTFPIISTANFFDFYNSGPAQSIPSPVSGVYTLYNSTKSPSPYHYDTLQMDSTTNKTVSFESWDGSSPSSTCTGYCDTNLVCINGTGTCNAPLKFYLRVLDISKKNVVVRMVPGDYYIESIWIHSSTNPARFIINGTGAVNLHVKYFRVQDNTWINNPSGLPGNFTLLLYDDPSIIPPWGWTTYNVDWSDPITMDGVILGGADTRARIYSGSYTLNGGILTQGTLSITNPVAVTYGTAAKAAVKKAMMNAPVPVHVGEGSWREY